MHPCVPGYQYRIPTRNSVIIECQYFLTLCFKAVVLRGSDHRQAERHVTPGGVQEHILP